MDRRVGRRGVAAAVVVLLLVMAGEVVHAIRGQSLTWDEGDHIFAGYRTWKTGDFGLNPEHPPMVKMLATLPLLPLDLKMPPLQDRFFKTEAYRDGHELLFRNSPAYGGRYTADTLIFRARLPALLFTLLAATLVFFAGLEMFGVEAGLAALLLFAFEPNLLAHGAYVTTDMALSCFLFATVYAFYRYVRRPSAGRLAVAGMAAGLALAAKHSAVLLLPILVVLILAELGLRLSLRRAEAKEREQLRESPAGHEPLLRAAGSLLGALGLVTLIGVTVLWAFYGFRYAARPAPLVLKPTLAEYVGPLAGVEARGLLLAAKLHALPESWLYGLADVRAIANGMPSFFFGRVYAHGVWFYFPALFTIKSTLGFLLLLVMTLAALATGRLRGRGRELLFLGLPPVVYLLIAMSSRLNIGARHILPVWVFGCVLAGAGAAAWLRGRGAGMWVAGALLAWHVGSSVHAAPNYIAYANEAWGGPTKTYRYLSDSNTDWGQQLRATAAYLEQHGIRHCWFAYFAGPFTVPEDYGIPCQLLPTSDTYGNDTQYEVPPVIDGPVLISAGDLTGFEFGTSVLNPYESFRTVTPAAYIQDGVFVFNGRFAVPLAAALSHVQRSNDFLEDPDGRDPAQALSEAREAVGLAPDAVMAELALANALAATKQPAAAAAAYERAKATTGAMDATSRATWLGKIKDGMDDNLEDAEE